MLLANFHEFRCSEKLRLLKLTAADLRPACLIQVHLQLFFISVEPSRART
jgi:hypothetical protein